MSCWPTSLLAYKSVLYLYTSSPCVCVLYVCKMLHFTITDTLHVERQPAVHELAPARVRKLTILPRCCEDRVSRSVKTLPHTEISLHTPGLESSVKPFRGCITKTPFVVKPSICPSDVLHFAAFSWKTRSLVKNLNRKIRFATCFKIIRMLFRQEAQIWVFWAYKH